MPKKLFISYSHKEGHFAERLALDLASSGLDVWIDRWNLRPGDSLTQKIGQGIRESDYFLPVISPAFLASHFALRELDEALMRQLARRSVQVVPILFRTCEPPSLLTSILWADFRRSYVDGLEALSKAVGIEVPPQDVVCIREVATLLILDEGTRFQITHDRLIEVTKPGITRFVDLNVFQDKPPELVTVNSGSATVESITGLHRITTVLPRPLPVRRPIRRITSYQGVGGPFDEDGSWFYRLPSNFNWSRAEIRFAPGCRLPREFNAVFDLDGFERPGPVVRKRKSKDWLTFTADLSSEMAKWRMLRFHWD
jgi:hypothetical protein